jgi:hypothetical protein
LLPDVEFFEGVGVHGGVDLFFVDLSPAGRQTGLFFVDLSPAGRQTGLFFVDLLICSLFFVDLFFVDLFFVDLNI